MKLIILFIGLIFTISDSNTYAYSPKTLKKTEKQTRKHFKEATSLIGFMPKHQNTQASNSSFFYIKNTQQTLLGMAIITTANGCVVGGCSISNTNETRFEQFDILSIYNREKELKSLVVLDYPGEHGFEISAKWWLKQFLGSSSAKHKYRENIDAISGATISAQSVIKEVNVLNAFVKTMTY